MNPSTPGSPEPATANARDPVCGMTVTPGKARGGSATHAGHEYWFCNPKCRDKFVADPDRYLANGQAGAVAAPSGSAASHAPGAAVSPGSTPERPAPSRGAAATAAASPPAAAPAAAAPPAEVPAAASSPAASAGTYTCPMHPEVRNAGAGDCPDCGMALEPEVPAVGTEYVCPMHPEIVRREPGSCPICGMALEPRTVTLEADNPELRDMTRRFAASAALTAPLVVQSMAEMLGAPVGHWLSPTAVTWIQLALATPVVAWAGWPLFVRGVRSIATGKLNMFTLIAIGIATAYGFSLIAMLAGGALPAAFRGHGGAAAVYFEAAAVITTLVLLGQVLELRARRATSQRDPRAARPRAPDRAAARRRRQRGRGRARPRRARRSAARPARREGAGRRRDRRRQERGRRVDGHRRADPGREGGGRRGSPAARSTAPAAW